MSTRRSQHDHGPMLDLPFDVSVWADASPLASPEDLDATELLRAQAELARKSRAQATAADPILTVTVVQAITEQIAAQVLAATDLVHALMSGNRAASQMGAQALDPMQTTLAEMRERMAHLKHELEHLPRTTAASAAQEAAIARRRRAASRKLAETDLIEVSRSPTGWQVVVGDVRQGRVQNRKRDAMKLARQMAHKRNIKIMLIDDTVREGATLPVVGTRSKASVSSGAKTAIRRDATA